MIYTLGQLTACVKKYCRSIADLEECSDTLKNRTYRIEKTYTTCCVAIAGATVNQAGDIVDRCGDEDFDIVRSSTGVYEITPPSGAIFAHIEAIESPTSRDSIEAHMGTSFTGGTAWIGEGDNGTAPNNLRDRPFSIVWFGEKEFLQDVELVIEDE